jgi:hypothetical protein
MPRAASIVLLLLGCLSGIRLAEASDIAESRASLRGLTSVYVVVDELDDAVEAAGLPRSELEATAENLVKARGIPLADRKAFYGSTTVGLLYVNVNLTREEGSTLWAATVDVSLKQRVILDRLLAVPTLAETWSSEELAVLHPEKLVRYLRAAVSDHVGRFVTAYRSVNPR